MTEITKPKRGTPKGVRVGGWPDRTRRYPVPGWKWHSILTVMGSLREICSRIESLGYQPPPPSTIQGWRFRNTVPTAWVPVIIQIALHGGFIRTIEDLRGPLVPGAPPDEVDPTQ